MQAPTRERPPQYDALSEFRARFGEWGIIQADLGQPWARVDRARQVVVVNRRRVEQDEEGLMAYVLAVFDLDLMTYPGSRLRPEQEAFAATLAAIMLEREVGN